MTAYLHERLRQIDVYLATNGPHTIPREQLRGAVLEGPTAERVIAATAEWPAESRTRFLSGLARGIGHQDVLRRDWIVATLRATAIRSAVASDLTPLTPNSPIELQALVAACGEDPEIARRFAASLAAGLGRQRQVEVLRPRDLAVVIESLAAGGFAQCEAVLRAAGAIDLSDENDAHADWWAAELLAVLVPAVVAVDPEGAYEGFKGAIDRALLHDAGFSRASTIWRPHIERAQGADEKRHLVLDGLRAGLDVLTRRNVEHGLGLASELWTSQVEIYRRVALALAASDVPWGPAFLDQRVDDVVRDGLNYGWEVEFKALLQQHGKDLDASRKESLEEWILAGPDLSQRAGDLEPHQVERARSLWMRDWLGVGEAALSSRGAERLRELSAALGPPDEARWERGVRSGFVRQVSPISGDELRQMGAPELAAALADVPERDSSGWSGEFTEVSHEGLIREVASVLPERPDWLRQSHALARDPVAWPLFVEAAAMAARGQTDSLRALDVLDLLNAALEGGGDTTATRPLADLVRWLALHEDLVAHSDKIVGELVRTARLVGRGEPGEDSDWDDPATAALNAPAGVVAEACCRALIRLATSEVPVADGHISELRQTVIWLSGRSETNAAISLWLLSLCEIFPDWSDDLRASSFPADETLFRAAWSTYVRFARLREGAGRLLLHEYSRAVDLDWPHGSRDVDEVVRSQSQHLVVLIAWGELDFTRERGLVDRWFSRLTSEQAAAANGFAADQAVVRDLPSEMRERLLNFARWRLTTGSREEFSQFGRWAAAPLPRADVLDLLRRASTGPISPVFGSEIVEFLAQGEEGAELEGVLSVLSRLVREADDWRLEDWEEPILSVLASAVDQASTRDQALALADDLARRGRVRLLELFEQGETTTESTR